MENWSLIENQSMLKTIFKDPPIISYKKGKSLRHACKSNTNLKVLTMGRNQKTQWESVQACL